MQKAQPLGRPLQYESGRTVENSLELSTATSARLRERSGFNTPPQRWNILGVMINGYAQRIIHMKATIQFMSATAGNP
jgi:hypothetical protein